MTGSAETVLAHGVGGSTDLPLPLSYALIGGVWALIITFAVVGVAWRTPRFDPAKPGRALPQWVTIAVDSPIVRGVLAAAAMVATAWVAVAAIWGPQGSDNALPGAFYVLLWVGLVAVSVVVGPIWRVISPVRTVWRLLTQGRRDRVSGDARRRYPAGFGYWPAALGLFAFVWLELASPDPGSLTAIKIWILGYAVAMLAGAAVFGSTWFARADPFEVYSVTVSRLAPFRRNPATGRIVIGNPLDHLPTMPVRPGTVAVMAVLLGSTAFDSFSQSKAFRNFVDRNADAVPFVGGLGRRGRRAGARRGHQRRRRRGPRSPTGRPGSGRSRCPPMRSAPARGPSRGTCRRPRRRRRRRWPPAPTPSAPSNALGIGSGRRLAGARAPGSARAPTGRACWRCP